MAIKFSERKTVRYTPKGLKWIEGKAEEAGVSVGRWIRQVSLGQRSHDGELIGKDNRLKELLTEYTSIGTNINQIAKVANETGAVNVNRFLEAKRELADLKLKTLEELQ